MLLIALLLVQAAGVARAAEAYEPTGEVPAPRSQVKKEKPAWYTFIQPQAELGYLTAFRLLDKTWTLRRAYAEVALKLPVDLSKKTGSTLTFNLVMKAFLEFVDNSTGTAYRTEATGEFRAANLKFQSEKLAITVGAQEIAWGETFGFHIADIVNPRDLTDPLFNDPEWQREAVVALNSQLLLESWTFQFIFTPFTRDSDFASPLGFFPVAEPPPEPTSAKFRRFGRDTEGGFRLGHLFVSGFDVNAFVYSHRSRNPAFQLGVGPSGPELFPIDLRVLSVGMSGSYAAGDFVFRGDVIHHSGIPVTAEDLGSPIVQNQTQSILGIDWTLAESQWTFGGQYHADFWSRGSSRTPRGLVSLHAISGRVAKPLLDGKLLPEIFVYQGLTARDRWIQPRLTWFPWQGLSFSLRADFVEARSSVRLEDGVLAPLADEDRVLFWTSLKF